ncbi:hypothetical protein ADUPG1_007079 [Aduncisulcus paluster]|uniref:Band 7 domain-containing protein n=1 Tax=Aduncisulcus paluster TaxID=2918883 RepID=A0ABQ5KKN7_9EUKA|nr:hypothetical protein ADUPG1_007079 [Aduncisulcus paluster]
MDACEVITVSYLVIVIIAAFGGIWWLIGLDKVEIGEYGILYNTVTKRIVEDKIADSGRQYAGWFKKYRTWPATYLSMELLNVVAIPQESTFTKFDISFQYTLDKEYVATIYSKYLEFDIYENRLKAQIRDGILEVVGNYKYNEFYTLRNPPYDSVDDLCYDSEGDEKTCVKKAFYEEFQNTCEGSVDDEGLYCEIKSVQLRRIYFSDDVEENIITQQVLIQEQNNETIRQDIAVREQNLQAVYSETDLLVAQILYAKVEDDDSITPGYYVNGNQTVSDGYGDAIATRTTAELEVISVFKDTVDGPALTDAQVLAYQKIRMERDKEQIVVVM